jgi:hypothetical protein
MGLFRMLGLWIMSRGRSKGEVRFADVIARLGGKNGQM